jgi:hypothetical protein
LSEHSKTSFYSEFRLLAADCSDNVLDRLIASYFPTLFQSALDIVRAFLRRALGRAQDAGDVWSGLRSLEFEAIDAALPRPAFGPKIATIRVA